jgi:hypothetical protein
VAFTADVGDNPFSLFYQPSTDIQYKVKIVYAGGSQAIASYTVTVIGVDGLAYGPVANLGRHSSPLVWGPKPLAKSKAGVAGKDPARTGEAVALGGSSSNAAGSRGSEGAEPTFAQAPTMPARWGQ